MKKIKELPKNTVFINTTAITYQNQHGDIYSIGKVRNKFEASIMASTLYRLFLLSEDERLKLW